MNELSGSWSMVAPSAKKCEGASTCVPTCDEYERAWTE